MDHFGKENLKELLEEQEPPAISLYVPTTRTTSDWEGDRLRFRGALERARELLSDDYEPQVYDPLLENLEALLDDQEFWLHQSDGLAVFRSPGLTRVYRLPTPVTELAVVGPTFHTRPLIQLLQAPDRYWILSLTQKEVRLWEGTSSGLRPINLGRVPKSLRDAVAKYVDYERESFHSNVGAGRSPAFHGHGPGEDTMEWELEEFFRKVDRGLGDLLDARSGPLILAAVDEYHSLFRSVSQLKNLAEDGIRGNVSTWSPDRLHEAARPIVERTVEKKLDGALRLWEQAYGIDKVEADLSAAARFAVAGRIRLLMTDRDRRIWGHMDRSTGAVEILGEEGEDPGNNAVELLDEVAEVVILHGGEALSMPGERLPSQSGVAAVLR